MAETTTDLTRRIHAELATVLDALAPAAADALIRAIAGARRIALHGLGREGLQMKGLAMRLYHLGLDAHVVGEMTTPPLRTGDLLVVSAGPGDFASIAALMARAKEAGARTAVVTAEPSAQLARDADVVLHIPAQTMARDRSPGAALLPMGSAYECAMMIVFEALVLTLRDRLGETSESMRARHTNLE
jgi:6-phospho-3-hexuloisomerase